MQKCKHLSVALSIDGERGLTLLDVTDIIYFECDSLINRIIVHTATSHYYTMGTLKFFVESLNNSGYNFKLVDRNNAVNIDNIVCVDTSRKLAYFETPIHAKSKSCTFSAKHFDNLVRNHSGGAVQFV